VEGRQELQWSTGFYKSDVHTLAASHVLDWYFLGDKVSYSFRFFLAVLSCCAFFLSLLSFLSITLFGLLFPCFSFYFIVIISLCELVIVNCIADLAAGKCLKKELLISTDDGKSFSISSFPDKAADLHVCSIWK
jgi:hypothetical protein